MKRLVLTAALAASVLGAAGAAQAQGYGRGGYDRNIRAPDRADQIAQRIERGAQRGDLTRREATSLRQQLGQVVRLERRYLADGRLNGWEARDLDQRFDQLQVRLRIARRDDDRRYY